MEGLDIRHYCIQQLAQKKGELRERLKLEEKEASLAIAKRIAVINEILNFDHPILQQEVITLK